MTVSHGMKLRKHLLTLMLTVDFPGYSICLPEILKRNFTRVENSVSSLSLKRQGGSGEVKQMDNKH